MKHFGIMVVLLVAVVGGMALVVAGVCRLMLVVAEVGEGGAGDSSGGWGVGKRDI